MKKEYKRETYTSREDVVRKQEGEKTPSYTLAELRKEAQEKKKETLQESKLK